MALDRLNPLLNFVLIMVLITSSTYYVRAATAAAQTITPPAEASSSSSSSSRAPPPQVTAMFAFGDSATDVGNSNYLNSVARANYLPYGYDFREGPTGRFTNGKTLVDLLGEMVGIPHLPPFADPATVGDRILRGVNYASSAGGILEETGTHLGERYSLNQQVINFESVTLEQLRTSRTVLNLTHYLAKSIVIMSFGTNDYINNYLLNYTSSKTYTPPQFANLLLNHYSRQILALHTTGLRKFLITGIPPIGCIPSQRATGRGQPGRCVDSVNQILGNFNDGLRSLVMQLNANHPGMIAVYVNTYRAVGEILNNPGQYGMKVVDRACCPVDTRRIVMTCLSGELPCLNRNEYVFWDGYHTTERVNAIVASRVYNGSSDYCYPINLQQLALI